MKRSDRCKGGFTLIEVIASAALLVIAAAGFMAMTAVHTNLLAKEYRIERSNYELAVLVYEGEGEATGETLTVEFIWEEGGQGTEEIFEEYRVNEEWEDMENSITFYRQR